MLSCQYIVFWLCCAALFDQLHYLSHIQGLDQPTVQLESTGAPEAGLFQYVCYYYANVAFTPRVFYGYSSSSSSFSSSSSSSSSPTTNITTSFSSSSSPSPPLLLLLLLFFSFLVWLLLLPCFLYPFLTDLPLPPPLLLLLLLLLLSISAKNIKDLAYLHFVFIVLLVTRRGLLVRSDPIHCIASKHRHTGRESHDSVWLVCDGKLQSLLNNVLICPLSRHLLTRMLYGWLGQCVCVPCRIAMLHTVLLV